jgi:hypothetical protein
MTKKDYQELFNTLTPRMQKQLIEYAEMLDREQQALDNIHNDLDNQIEHGDFKIVGNKLYL